MTEFSWRALGWTLVAQWQEEGKQVSLPRRPTCMTAWTPRRKLGRQGALPWIGIAGLFCPSAPATGWGAHSEEGGPGEGSSPHPSITES